MRRLLLAVPLLVCAQQAPTIEEYEPRAMLVVPKTETPRAKYPFVDIHVHNRDSSASRLDALLADMDRINMRIMLNSPVRGGFGAALAKHMAGLRAHPGAARFASMTNIDFSDLGKAPQQLEEDIRAGAIGLKVHKNLGITEKDPSGARIPIDDPRLAGVWRVCAERRIPVMIHSADPKPLFDPMDKYNERWLELRTHPKRQQTGPSWDQLMREQHNLFAQNPKTTFIAAHFGWMAHDLAELGRMLDRMPNLHLEFSAIFGELGRQPRAARAFFIKYQDRILFGKDRYDITEYPFYFRMLESADEWIPNIRKYHGLWQLYALDLPDGVLKKIYYKNALRLFPTLPKAGFPE